MKLYIFVLLILIKNCICLNTNKVIVDISDFSKNEDNGRTKEFLETIPHSELESYDNSFVEILPLESVESFKPSDGLRSEKIIDISNFEPDYVIDSSNEFNESSSDTIELIEANPNSAVESDTELNLSTLDEEGDIDIEQVEEATVSNQAIAQWVAGIIFSAILLYVVIFIIHVAILECKGRGKRTTDEDKIGSSSEEKQKLLNGAAVSENPQDYYPINDFENCNKGYTEVDLSLENSSDRTSQDNRVALHHLLGSPVAEVEVFPHGTLRPPSNKGCLQFQNDIIT